MITVEYAQDILEMNRVCLISSVRSHMAQIPINPAFAITIETCPMAQDL